MEELKSHPHRLLKDHLLSVGRRSKEEILKKELNLKIIKKEQLADIAYLIGVSHDFGKATTSFQDFMKKLEENPNFDGPHEDHAAISAIFGYFLVKKFCDIKHLHEIFAWITSLTIKKHHQNLSDVLSVFEQPSRLLIKKQVEELKSKKGLSLIYGRALNKIGIDYSNIIYRLDFNEEVFDEKQVFSKLRECNPETAMEFFLITELLFSVLIDYDKKDAAGIIDVRCPTLEFDEKIVDKYLDKKQKKKLKKFNLTNPLNQLKNEFYKKVTNNKNIRKENKIYTITAPTGIGKTLTVLSIALKLRKIVGSDYKIIYVLPFTSIIDQNYDIFEEVLKNYYLKEFENSRSDFILKHHYLSHLEIKKENYNSDNYLNDLLIIKSWDCNIIVSTYVQLLMTIIGYKDSFLNKFHNIINSIIILDEVQFIGVEYWKIIRDLFKVLSKRFNVYFIFMTATQPLIFSDTESKELADKSFFNNPLNKKVKYHVQKEKQSLDNFKESFITEFNKSPRNRILIILNTKKSTLEFYNFLNEKEQKSQFKGYKLFYLSTNLIPCDREKIIQDITNLQQEKNAKYIIVTTQLIEAGVDISSDLCYRDIAPIDSICQSAGRCNRYNEIKKGEFKIINLVNNNNRPYYVDVYTNSYEMNETFRLLPALEGKTHINEQIKEYFKSIKGNKHSNKLFNAILELDFKTVEEEFRIVQKEYPTKTIFLCREDDIAPSLLNEFKDKIKKLATTNSIDKFKKLGELKKTKIKMQKYLLEIISDPKKGEDFEFLLNENLVETIGNFHYVPIDKMKEIYNPKIGFGFYNDSLKRKRMKFSEGNNADFI
jgi:CRISPR-associated endonuclease/helicase Cas3